MVGDIISFTVDKKGQFKSAPNSFLGLPAPKNMQIILQKQSINPYKSSASSMTKLKRQSRIIRAIVRRIFALKRFTGEGGSFFENYTKFPSGDYTECATFKMNAKKISDEWYEQ